MVSFILIIACVVTPIPVHANGLVEELFGISFYKFHSMDENGREVYQSFYNWGSDDEAKNGIKIQKVGAEKVKVVIDADSNEIYQSCKPVLMWMHKADGMFDTTKYTDIEKWYRNKLEETFLLCAIDDYTQDCEITIDVPLKLNIGLTGIINGGYYEIEFYSIDAIPKQLEFAYKAQSYTIEELEQYIQYEMSDTMKEYYNVDSGFRSNVNGFPFRNSDYRDGKGVCAGYSSVATAKYNGYPLVSSYKTDKGRYTPNSEHTWYESIYGNGSIRDIVLENQFFVEENSPSYSTVKDGYLVAYPLQYFPTNSDNDEAFFQLLEHYQYMNNAAVLAGGNHRHWQQLDNRWGIIEYVASYMRQGKAVSVNLSSKNEGHTVVGYRMEQIDEDTYRMYCYDSNWPDDKSLHYIEGAPKNEDLDTSLAYENITWSGQEVYIDFTRKTIIGRLSATTQREYEKFDFDASHTSLNVNSNNGYICFSLCKGDSVGVFNYGNESNTIIAYKAYPVIMSDNTVQIRTFAFYKSGEVSEVTDSVNTTVKMDYDFIGWYKIKDSKITLTKKNYKFDNNGTKYIECLVTYNNHDDSYGSVTVRIPIA